MATPSHLQKIRHQLLVNPLHTASLNALDALQEAIAFIDHRGPEGSNAIQWRAMAYELERQLIAEVQDWGVV